MPRGIGAYSISYAIRSMFRPDASPAFAGRSLSEFVMSDLIYVLLGLGGFAVCVAFVHLCARI